MDQATDKLQKKAARFSLKTAIVIGIFILAICGFWIIADEMVIENENGYDKWAFAQLRPFTNEGNTALMEIITFFGSSYFLFPAYTLIVIIYLLRRDWKYSLNIASVGLWNVILVPVIKAFFHRQRPPDPLIQGVTDFSFPSGHSFSAFTFFGLLIYITLHSRLRPLWKGIIAVLFFLFAVSIAISRVYLHVHYASDVTGGFLLAAIWLITSLVILRKLDKRLANKSAYQRKPG